MANLNIEIDADQLTSLGELIAALEADLGVAFIPGFLRDLGDTVSIESARFERDPDNQRYVLGFAIGIKIDGGDEGDDSDEDDDSDEGDDSDEDEAERLRLEVNISVSGDTAEGGKRSAEYEVKFDIPVSAGTLTTISFTGKLTAQRGNSSALVLQCTLGHEQGVPLHAMFGGLAPLLSALIPEDFVLPFGQTLVAVMVGRGAGRRGARSRFLLGASFHANIDLGQIPVVGVYFKEEQTSGRLALEMLFSTDNFTPAQVEELNGALEEAGSPLLIRTSSAPTKQPLERGVCLVGYAAMGDIQSTWYMPLRRRSRTQSPRPPAAASGRSLEPGLAEGSLVTFSDNHAWIAIERGLGPIHLGKIGLSYRDGAAEIVPEFVITIGDLRVVLNGLTIRLPISSKADPMPRLDGLGIEYKNDSLLVGGAFLYSPRGESKEYSGAAAIQIKLGGFSSIGIAAIGAYADDEKPSLFLYAAVNFPLGGPPCFFVTGLAGGFGVNRDLVSPELEEVADFPLVRLAMNNEPAPDMSNPGGVVADQLTDLDDYITVAPDTGFLAAGIKFTSFKLIDGFVLMTLVLGDRFEIGLLGLARMQVPPLVASPLVVLEVALQVRIAPSDGVILVRGQLTPNSYLLSESCKLTGGFAFGVWFKGDFVLTMGGYHPSFDKPSYYPTVPRVGLDWRLGSTFTIRGEAYFALCAHAFMLGMSVEASFRAGLAFASFHIGADFLISWKPYAYEISLYCHFKAGFGILKASLGAELHLWGPEFGGKAKIKVIFFSFTISFGNQDSTLPKPIDWEDFCESFLPAEKEMCSIAVSEGLTRQVKHEGKDKWVINPKEFALVTDSVIPSKTVTYPRSDDQEPISHKVSFGIAPMAVKSSDLTSEHHISIWFKKGKESVEVEKGKFKFTPLTRQAPTSLWGEPQVELFKGEERLRLPGVNAPAFVEGAICGLRIEPATPPRGGDTEDLPVDVLGAEVEPYPRAYAFVALPAFRAAAGDDDQRRATIKSTSADRAARDALLEDLGFDPAADVALHAGVEETFVFAPQVKDMSAAA